MIQYIATRNNFRTISAPFLAICTVVSAALLYASNAHAEDRQTYILELNAIHADKVDSGEPGSENEFFGNFRAGFFLGDGTGLAPNASDGAKYPESSRAILGDDYMKATRILWQTNSDRALDVEEGQSKSLARQMTIELTNDQFAKARLEIVGVVQEYDTTSADDELGSKSKEISLNTVTFNSSGQFPITLDGFKDGGDEAHFSLTLRKQKPSEILSRKGLLQKPTILEQQHPNFLVNGETAKTKLEKFPQAEELFEFQRVGSQTPFVDSKVIFSTANDLVGDRYLLVNLYKTNIGASDTAKLDNDDSETRGWFLEQLKIKIGAKGLSVDRAFPENNQESATITTALGASLGADASLSGPSAGAKVSASTSTSITYKDFVITTSGRNPITHSYDLGQTEGERYDGPGDLPRHAAIQLRLNKVPARAITNMPVGSWVMFKVPQSMNMDAVGPVDVTIDYTMKLRRVRLKLDDVQSESESRTFEASVDYKVDLSNLDVVVAGK